MNYPGRLVQNDRYGFGRLIIPAGGRWLVAFFTRDGWFVKTVKHFLAL